MIIVDSTTTKKGFSIPKPVVHVSLITLTTLIAAPAIFAITQNAFTSPTGTYLNPLPQQELAQATPTPTTQTSPEQMILTAQSYLEKAISVSQKTPQTDLEKQQIITLLNSGLEFANQAVTTAPNAPESYLVRARILASSTSIRTDATQLAQKDLETAQLLSGGQQVTLPTQVNLLNYTPTEQASLAQNIIIAAPEDGRSATSSATANSNIIKKTTTIKANQSSTTIQDTTIKTSSYIYLISLSGGQTPFIQTKDTGTATISITQPTTQDLVIEYWIVNP